MTDTYNKERDAFLDYAVNRVNDAWRVNFPKYGVSATIKSYRFSLSRKYETDYLLLTVFSSDWKSDFKSQWVIGDRGNSVCYEDIWKVSVRAVESFRDAMDMGENNPTPATTLPPDTTIQDTLKERGKRYGEFKEHAKISQSLKRAMWATQGWVDLPDDTKEALEMIQHKIARVLNGDPEYEDNFVDLAGYSQLVLDRILKDKKGAAECPTIP